MTGLIRVVGVDAGPTPGMVSQVYTEGRPTGVPTVVQCSWSIALHVFDWLIDGDALMETYVGVERFRIGNKSRRAGSAGQLTLDQVGRLQEAVQRVNAVRPPNAQVYLALRPAVDVKAWGTDKRLAAAGLLAPTKGMTHARDGARHMLYAAVHDGLAIDPLSRKAARDG